ncbi:MAG: divergent PAP2 family protein [Clostridia bacterium]|nr:divergent PAP2 family protein [Clostridia bacterium]
MRVLMEIAQNRVLLTSGLAWIVAQALKVVFTFISERKIDLHRMLGLGGMPSSHSAVVCALATGCGLSNGFYSVEFAIAAILATVVMTDAAGVRRAASRQAVQINLIVKDLIESGHGLTYENMKELLGHTPFQVLVGAILGVILAFLAV